MKEVSFPGIFDEIQTNLLPQDGIMEYRFPFYTPEESEKIFERLMRQTPWSLKKIHMYGKVLDLPRLSAWYGDRAKGYSYSHIELKHLEWTDELLAIKEKIEGATNAQYNGVLLNLYRDEKDHVSWHADNEKELGPQSIIASLSFGATRKFQVKHKYVKDIASIGLNLEAGSLVVMRGGMQDHWLHRIAPAAKSVGPRINLTFRLIK